MTTIEEVQTGYRGRLKCPFCNKRIKAIGITDATRIKDATVKCQSCGREFRIEVNNESGL